MTICIAGQFWREPISLWYSTASFMIPKLSRLDFTMMVLHETDGSWWVRAMIMLAWDLHSFWVWLQLAALSEIQHCGVVMCTQIWLCRNFFGYNTIESVSTNASIATSIPKQNNGRKGEAMMMWRLPFHWVRREHDPLRQILTLFFADLIRS